jgi:hypothetical protein
MTGGEVDGNVQRATGSVRGLPERQVAAGFADHPLIDQGHEAGVFRSFEKLAGADETLFGMLPAKQPFKADDLADRRRGTGCG